MLYLLRNTVTRATCNACCAMNRTLFLGHFCRNCGDADKMQSPRQFPLLIVVLPPQSTSPPTRCRTIIVHTATAETVVLITLSIATATHTLSIYTGLSIPAGTAPLQVRCVVAVGNRNSAIGARTPFTAPRLVIPVLFAWLVPFFVAFQRMPRQPAGVGVASALLLGLTRITRRRRPRGLRRHWRRGGLAKNAAPLWAAFPACGLARSG